jgi:hypothetical protein
MICSKLCARNGLRPTPLSTISQWGCKDSMQPMQLTMVRLRLPPLRLVTLLLHLLQETRPLHRQMANLRRLLVSPRRPLPLQDKPARSTTWLIGPCLIPSGPIYDSSFLPRTAYGYDVNSEAFKQWYSQTMAASGAQGTAGAAPPGPA